MLLLSGCSAPPGQPRKASETLSPNEVVEFGTLYSENCAGCHGAEGRGGAAIALADPVYLGLADETAMRKVIANGVRGTSMPAFAQSAGGMLTDKQIDALVSGVRSWASPEALIKVTPPPYSSQIPGNPQRGANAYRTYCSSCHGADGRGGTK